MSESSTLFVGLNVRKENIDVVLAFPGREDELRHVGAIKGNLAALDKSLRKVVSLGYLRHVVIEAGLSEFSFWRQLVARCLSCKVVASSSIAKPKTEWLPISTRSVCPMWACS